MDGLYEWVIAVKETESIPVTLKEKLLALECRIIDEKTFLHVHLHIPADHYHKAEQLLNKHHFTLQTEHPKACSAQVVEEGFEVFNKRVPIIEAREQEMIKELLNDGILMSGGAGKPHVHISIPSEKRDVAVKLLQDAAYYPS